MKNAQKLPDLPENALRDHGDDATVERIWQRLDGDLALRRPRPRSVILWAPAALAIVFGLGIFVGARWFAVTAPIVATPVGPEPVLEQSDELPSQAPLLPATEQKVDHSEAPVKRAPMSVQQGAAGASATSTDVLLSPAPTTLLVPQGPPQWETLVGNGDYRGAWNSMGQGTGFDALLSGAASGDQLMNLYDVARDVKEAGRAMQALKAVVDRFPNDPNAQIAALKLSQILGKAGDHAGSAKYAALSRSLSPKGDFAEDALIQQIKSAVAQGDAELAKKLSEQYEKDYPTSKRLDDVRALVGKSKPDSSAKKKSAPIPEEAPVDDEEEAPPAPTSAPKSP
jgi:TolA-binding protein